MSLRNSTSCYLGNVLLTFLTFSWPILYCAYSAKSMGLIDTEIAWLFVYRICSIFDRGVWNPMKMSDIGFSKNWTELTSKF